MRYFTLEELTRSTTATELGIDNSPTSAHLANIVQSVRQLLDPLRETWGVECTKNGWGTPALRVSSGYRGFRLNSQIDGASSLSAHSVGYAFDLVALNGKMAEFKRFCREWLSSRGFDQLISEDEDHSGTPRWMHIGYKNRQGMQRRQMLSMVGGEYKMMTL